MGSWRVRQLAGFEMEGADMSPCCLMAMVVDVVNKHPRAACSSRFLRNQAQVGPRGLVARHAPSGVEMKIITLYEAL